VIINVLGALAVLFAASRVFLRFREGKVSSAMFVVWTMIWVSALAFIISPTSFDSFSKLIGIQRPLDLALVAALIVSFYLVFRIHIFLEDIRLDVARLAREIALMNKKP
jgi:hypothetical protein